MNPTSDLICQWWCRDETEEYKPVCQQCPCGAMWCCTSSCMRHWGRSLTWGCLGACPLSRVAAQNRQSSHVVWLQSVLTTNYLFFSRMNETEYRSIDQKRTLSLGDRPYKVGRFTNFPSYWGAWRKFSENSSTLGGKEIGWNKKFKIKKGCIFQKEKNGSDQK